MRFDLLGFADQMGEAGLAILGFNGVVTRVVIGDQSALEIGTEKMESHLARAGVIDVKAAEVIIASKPEIGALAVDAPVGFVAVNDVGAANLIAKALMQGLGGAGGALWGQGSGPCIHANARMQGLTPGRFCATAAPWATIRRRRVDARSGGNGYFVPIGDGGAVADGLFCFVWRKFFPATR